MTERPTQAARRKFAVPRKVLPYLMLAPALIIIFVFKIYPIVSVMITSFIRDGQFTFRTYEILLGDRTFWMSLWTTIKMNLVMIPLQVEIMSEKGMPADYPAAIFSLRLDRKQNHAPIIAFLSDLEYVLRIEEI